jgi:catechol 2,3-dioxygenase-like lactoylglutathione lyase family enzyme
MRVTGLDHVGLHVADPGRSRAFYTAVLGLEEIARPDLGFPGHWLRVGTRQELHLIGRNAHTDAPPAERHFALAVTDLDAWLERLRAHGVAASGPRQRPDGARQVFLRDPDGHVIELLERASMR